MVLDYTSLTSDALNFNAGTFHCYDIEILSDIEFEGNKNFTVDITHLGLNRIDISPAARVIIIDYNGEWLETLCVH